ncbi:MAG: sortase domain-bontaining protein [Dehalococcoidia bacterium]
MGSSLLNKFSVTIIIISIVIFLITISYLIYGLYSQDRLSNLNASQNISIIDGYSADMYVNAMHPKDWNSPTWGVKDDISNIDLIKTLPDSYNISNKDLTGPAIQITIPTINVISEIKQLNVITKDGISNYETPKNMVGRISSNIERMDSVSGWYFGHFDSPIQREGNVFNNLPKIATHIKNGDPVLIYIKSPESEYVYKAVSSEVMHESNLKLYDAGIEHIVLVTCANKPFYDHRQLVKAKLIDIN